MFGRVSLVRVEDQSGVRTLTRHAGTSPGAGCDGVGVGVHTVRPRRGVRRDLSCVVGAQFSGEDGALVVHKDPIGFLRRVWWGSSVSLYGMGRSLPWGPPVRSRVQGVLGLVLLCSEVGQPRPDPLVLCPRSQTPWRVPCSVVLAVFTVQRRNGSHLSVVTAGGSDTGRRYSDAHVLSQ